MNLINSVHSNTNRYNYRGGGVGAGSKSFTITSAITNWNNSSDVSVTSTYNGMTYNIYAFKSTGVTYSFNYSCSSTANIYILAVGGGGGGGSDQGGGGGGGGVIQSTTSILGSDVISITVGGGGATETNGSNTTVNWTTATSKNITAIGGGHGGTYSYVSTSGGSGGGGGGARGNATNNAGSAGIVGQGKAGGSGYVTSGTPLHAGGGGGASNAGDDWNIGRVVNSVTYYGSGGNGAICTLPGITTSIYGNYYWGGGGGASAYSTVTYNSININYSGVGGLGGGGGGGIYDTSSYPAPISDTSSTAINLGTSGTTTSIGNGGVNTGGGGGGGSSGSGRAGGSGIVIIAFLAQDNSIFSPSDSMVWWFPCNYGDIAGTAIANYTLANYAPYNNNAIVNYTGTSSSLTALAISNTESVTGGSSLYVNGTLTAPNMYGSLNYGSALTLPGSTGITYCCWIKTDRVPTSSYCRLFQIVGSGNDYNYVCSTDRASSNLQYPQFVMNQSKSGGLNMELKVPVFDNTWHHILITNQSTGGWKIYIDNVVYLPGSAQWNTSGASDATFIYQGLTATAASVNVLGAPGDRIITGYYDDIRMYTRGVTAAEVAAIYNYRGSMSSIMPLPSIGTTGANTLVMTADTTTISGITGANSFMNGNYAVTYSSMAGSSNGWYAFDNNTSGIWHSGYNGNGYSIQDPYNTTYQGAGSGYYWTTVVSGQTVAGEWLQIKFPYAFTLTYFNVYTRIDIQGWNWKAFTIAGSNDGTTWTLVDSKSYTTLPTSGDILSITTPSGKYSYYKFIITSVATQTNIASCGNLKLFGRF